MMTISLPSQSQLPSPLVNGGAKRDLSDKNILIAAVDPGAMCGVSIFQWYGEQRFFAASELTPHGAVAYVRRFIDEISGWLVVAERFTPSKSVMTVQLDAVEVIGALRFIVLDSPRLHHRFILQPRAEAKKIATNAVLKKLDWHRATKDGHANDSTRHVLLALLTHYPVVYERLMFGIQST